jgi:membrane associated rhomboid family serine protease
MFNAGVNRFGSTAPVVKNLIIINVLMLLATYVFQSQFNINLTRSLALFYPESDSFRVYQVITHMFMHSTIDPFHLIFNMFSLWMFGRALESAWGGKRFLIFYLLTGLGAAALHTLVNYIEIAPMHNAIKAFAESPSPALLTEFAQRFVPDSYEKTTLLQYAANWNPNYDYINNAVSETYKVYDILISVPTVGASGAVYGVLLGFGMLFPNTVLMLLFPPIPIKAKYLVMIFAGIELYMGISQPGSNIAHFAHLGGMLFGYLLIKYWNRKRANFY